jgi:hypothetical protein
LVLSLPIKYDARDGWRYAVVMQRPPRASM